MQLLRIRRSDGVVVERVDVSGRDASRVPSSNEEYEWVARDRKIANDCIMRRDAAGRFRQAARAAGIHPHTVLAVRYSELLATDAWAVSDRPGNAPWLAYRQALRDVTAGGRTVAAMLKRFPLRPDGTDPVAHLR